MCVGKDRKTIYLQAKVKSYGLAIGYAKVNHPQIFRTKKKYVENEGIPAEISRFNRAIKKMVSHLKEFNVPFSPLALALPKSSQYEAHAIFKAYVLMAQDPELCEQITQLIQKENCNAEWAVEKIYDDIFFQFSRTKNAYLEERKRDIEFIKKEIIQRLIGQPKKRIHPSPAGSQAKTFGDIFCATELSPADAMALRQLKIKALCCEKGTDTGHTAIVFRSLDIPYLMGIEGLLEHVTTGDLMIVDGDRSLATIWPNEEEVQTTLSQIHSEKKRKKKAVTLTHLTACKTSISLEANVNMLGAVKLLKKNGATGVGLFRTEFLYMNRHSLPTEDEQYLMYKRILKNLNGLHLTLRTFDFGGDKWTNFSTFSLKKDKKKLEKGWVEKRPSYAYHEPRGRFASQATPSYALGLKPIRLALKFPDVFKIQLRAMVRASAHGPLKIMIPMIRSVDELLEAKAHFKSAISELKQEGIEPICKLELGMMIEVPSAALLLDLFAKHVDFFSVGTNDLVQYTLAVDRYDPHVSHLSSYFHPAFLRLLQSISDETLREKKVVSVCGAMSSDPYALILLLGMGFRLFSVDSPSISKLHFLLSQLELGRCQELARTVLKMESSALVYDYVKKNVPIFI